MDDLIYLASCVANGVPPDGPRVKAMDLDALYKAASRHSLRAVAAYALESAGVSDPRFTRAKAHAAARVMQMDVETEAVLSALEAAGIWYMPLKGFVLQRLYPRFGMREMNDRDILFDESRAADVKTIMEGLGFAALDYGKQKHDKYFKEPVCNFEMHRALFWAASEDMAAYTAYYENVKDRLVKDGGNRFGYHFTPEDFYVYFTVHAFKHFAQEGIRLRALLDTCLYLKSQSLDWDYILAELKKTGAAGFESSCRSLALHLFGNQALTPADEELLKTILSRGEGDAGKRRIENQVAAAGGRKAFFFSKLTYPNQNLVNRHPLLKKLPILYPVFSLLRFMGRFFRGKLSLRTLRAALKAKNK